MKAEVDRADQAEAEDIERNSMAAAIRAEADLATRTRTKAEVATTSLMEAVVERGNLMLAYQRVVENKGAAGRSSSRSRSVSRILDSSGDSGPPCGVPSVRGCTKPSAIMPASRYRRISVNTRTSPIFATNLLINKS